MADITYYASGYSGVMDSSCLFHDSLHGLIYIHFTLGMCCSVLWPFLMAFGDHCHNLVSIVIQRTCAKRLSHEYAIISMVSFCWKMI